MPGDMVRLSLVRRPFGGKPGDLSFPHACGKAVGDYLDDAEFTVMRGCEAFVEVGNEKHVRAIDIEEWDTFIPDPGDLICVNTLPQKGGSKGKSPVQTLFSIAGLALAFYAPPVGSSFSFLGNSVFAGLPKLTWGSVAGFALSSIGGLIAQPPQEKLSDLSGAGLGSRAPDSPTLKIDGAGNQLLPYGKVPRPLGKVRWEPPLGARSYREVVGKKLYFRMLIAFSGPNKVEDITFGETPYTEFPGVEINIREGWPSDPPSKLFSDDIFPEIIDAILKQANGWSTRNTLVGVDEATLHFMCPRLAELVSSSTQNPLTVELEAQYAPVGTENWLPCPWQADGEEGLEVDGLVTITDNLTSEVWRGARMKFPANGDYKIRSRRNTIDAVKTSILDETRWAALHSIRYTSPINTSIPMTTVEVRLEANDDLNGIVPVIRMTTTSYFNIYNPGTGLWTMTLSESPAWACVDALMASHNPRPLTDARMDLDGFDAFDAHCTAQGLKVSGVIDYRDSVMGIFNDIAEAGWGRFMFNANKFSVIWDQLIAAPSQHFTPHNTISFEREKLFPQRPHGLLCSFKNRDVGYQRDKVPVYAPGYNEKGTDGKLPATRFENREYHLIADLAQVVKSALREIGSSIHRDINLTLNTKMDHLATCPGKTVSVTRPETGWGLGSSRVVSVAIDHVVLADAMPMTAGKAYSVGFRYSKGPLAGTQKIFDVLPKGTSGEFTTLEFATYSGGAWIAANIAAADFPTGNVEDLVQFGETNFIARIFHVDYIKHQNGNRAELYLSPYAAAEVQAVIAGGNPPYISPMSNVPVIYARPGKPVIKSVYSDETVLIALAGGGWRPRIVVSLMPRGGEDYLLRSLQVRHRRTDGSQYSPVTAYPANTTEVCFEDVIQGVTYTAQLRVLTKNGLPSEWTEFTETVLGQSSPPPDPDALYVEKLPDGTLRYRVVGDLAVDHQGWRFKWNPEVNLDWGQATVAHGGVWSADTFEKAAFIERTFTVLVKTVDMDGNESAGLSYAIVRLGDQVRDNLVDSVDFSAQAFPGTLTGGTLTGGELLANATGVLFTDPAQPLFNDPSAALFDGYETMVYEASFSVLRRGFLQLVTDFDGGALIEYRTEGDEILFLKAIDPLFTDPTDPLYPAPPFITYQGPFEVKKGLKYVLRVTIPGSPVRGRIGALTCNIDVPTVTERLEDVVVPAAGLRLTLTNTFETIIKIGFTVQEAPGYTAVTARTLDKDVILGPLVMPFDIIDAATDGLLDIDVQGILKA
ncbi:MAG: hypothetical protein HQ494_08920 [Rhodospirillales bacterium]|nr:hypothetical protein [Rhodospirillales bacterium]